jgi:hypothetical protein
MVAIDSHHYGPAKVAAQLRAMELAERNVFGKGS